ncbi:hypothetical protein GCM10010271_70120 [Streptomyces kurssanovii]|nr:hypothetical protein GCM10010271_70120 [Streptomyces kurssanovii]
MLPIGNTSGVGYGEVMPHMHVDPSHAAVMARRQTFGRRLRTLRTTAGLSQAQLAEAAGLNRVFYVGVEGGKRNVSLDKIFALAEALHIDVTELFRSPGEQADHPTA